MLSAAAWPWALLEKKGSCHLLYLKPQKSLPVLPAGCHGHQGRKGEENQMRLLGKRYIRTVNPAAQAGEDTRQGRSVKAPS